jgi:hypothetical protein
MRFTAHAPYGTCALRRWVKPPASGTQKDFGHAKAWQISTTGISVRHRFATKKVLAKAAS